MAERFTYHLAIQGGTPEKPEWFFCLDEEPDADSLWEGPFDTQHAAMLAGNQVVEGILAAEIQSILFGE